MARRSLRAALLLLFALPVFSSCGPKEKFQGKPVFPVRGQVFFLGKPATGGLVIFRPAQDAADLTSWPKGYPSARVQPDGSFQLSTYAAFDGAPAGDYDVVVAWTDETAEQDPRRARYMDPKTSGLRATVKEQANELDAFRLK